MEDTERITQPSPGSNDAGEETNDTHLTAVSSGTETQLKLAVKSGDRDKKNINDDEEVVRNRNGEIVFLKSGETDG